MVALEVQQINTSKIFLFLDHLFMPEDWITFRLTQSWDEDGKKRTKVVAEHCYQRSDITATHLKMLCRDATATRSNLFFGVNPRCGESGSVYAKDGSLDYSGQIPCVRCLYADLDSTSPADAAKLTPTPTMVLGSGRGSHCYWRLDEPVMLPHHAGRIWHSQIEKKKYHRVNGEKIWGEPAVSPAGENVSRLLEGLAKHVGGDHTTDLARLFRCPGVPNFKGAKNGKPAKPVDVYVVRDDLTYTLADFEQYALPETPKKAKAVTPLAAPRSEPLSTDVSCLAKEIKACEDAEIGKRSDMDFALCCAAVRRGVDPVAVYDAVSSVSKFAERGESYFSNTWDRAEAKINADAEQFAELDEALEKNVSPLVETPQALVDPDKTDPRFAYLWQGQHRRVSDEGRARRIASIKTAYTYIPPTGFFADYMSWATPATDAPVLFHVSGALMLAAHYLNRRVALQFGPKLLYPQLWVANIADSTVDRKSTATGMAVSWFRKDDHYHHTLLSSAFSMEGIYSHLGVKLDEKSEDDVRKDFASLEDLARVDGTPFLSGVGLFAIDELGAFLSAMDAAYNRGGKKVLTELMDFQGDAFTKKLATGGYYIHRPHLNILAASTVDWVCTTATESDRSGGFLPRWLLVCNWGQDYRLSLPDPHPLDIAVKTHLERLKTLSGVFTLSADAQDYYHDWDQRFFKVTDQRIGPWVNRMAIMALKVALVYASTSGGETVEASHLELACRLIERCRADLEKLMRWDLAFDESERQKMKVLKVIETAPYRILHSTALKDSHIPAKTFKAIIDHLEEEERIVVIEEPAGNGKMGKWYTGKA